MNIKRNDNVIVIAGKDKGKKGKVVKVLAGKSGLVIEGVNLKKRRKKPTKRGEKGQVVEVTLPIAYSNALVVCSSCGKGVRLGAKIDGDKKTRVCKSCGKSI